MAFKVKKYSDLRNYQLRTIDFIKWQMRAMLMLDMGLGKTVSVLTAVSELCNECAIDKVLIIAPLRVANTVWKQECQQWEHLQHLDVGIATGDEQDRIRVLNERHMITVINRENTDWLQKVLTNKYWDYDVLVVDESSSFKTRTSKRFLALKKLVNNFNAKIPYRITLTGTPAPQGYIDLWSQYYILDNGKRLGASGEQYESQYFVTTGYQNRRKVTSGAKAEQIILDKIRDITLVMESEDYLELPPLIQKYIEIELPPKAQQQYDDMKKDYVLELEDETLAAFSETSVMGKLQQISNGAIYHAEDDLLEEGSRRYTVLHDEKIKALADLVEDNPNQTWLVAYAFKHDLDRILKKFPFAKTMDAEGSQIEAWNRREIKMLVVHPASVGHGLNLQHGGNQLVFFGLSWSLELYMQIIKRLYRSGQQESNVVVSYIISSDKKNIDRDMLKALDEKAATQDAIFKRLKETL